MNWNLAVVVQLADDRTPFGLLFFSRFTEFGGTAVVTLAALLSLFVVLWRGKRWAHALGLVVSLGGSLAVAEILKFIVREARPPEILHAVYETGYSFPSNHSTAAVALYGFLAWTMYDLKVRGRFALGVLALAVILLIGFSRLYLGVHYPIDVLGGYVLGAIFLWLGTIITRKLEAFED